MFAVAGAVVSIVPTARPAASSMTARALFPLIFLFFGGSAARRLKRLPAAVVRTQTDEAVGRITRSGFSGGRRGLPSGRGRPADPRQRRRSRAASSPPHRGRVLRGLRRRRRDTEAG